MSRDEVILLVEDEQDYAVLVKDALVCAHILNPVYLVENGEEAVAYLSGKGKYSDRYTYPFPALLVLDLRMPGMGGFGVLRWLRAHAESGQDLDVVVVSGSMSRKEMEVTYELGALAYLTKSSGSTELWELAEYLKRKLLAEEEPENPSPQITQN